MGAIGILAGAGAGAVLGLIAGPPGAVLGAVLGGLAVAIRGGGGIETRIAALSNEGLWGALCAAQNPGRVRPEIAARLVADLGVIPGPEHVALIGAEAERRGVDPKHDCAELLKPLIVAELDPEPPHVDVKPPVTVDVKPQPKLPRACPPGFHKTGLTTCGRDEEIIVTDLDDIKEILPKPSAKTVKKLRKIVESEFLAFACNPPKDVDWPEAIAAEVARRGIFGLTGRCAKLSGFSGLRARGVR